MKKSTAIDDKRLQVDPPETRAEEMVTRMAKLHVDRIIAEIERDSKKHLQKQRVKAR